MLFLISIFQSFVCFYLFLTPSKHILVLFLPPFSHFTPLNVSLMMMKN